MLRIPVQVSWSSAYVPPEGRAWVVYGSRKANQKGRRLGRFSLQERHGLVHLREGIWYVRVLLELCNCTEEPWRTAKVTRLLITGREHTPSLPGNVGIAPVDDGSHGAVIHDPPAIDDPPHTYRVIECESGAPRLGTVVAEYAAPPGGALENPGHNPKARFPLPGSVAVPAASAYHTPERVLALQAIGRSGRGSDFAEEALHLPELHRHGSVLIAQVDTNGGSYSGFQAPVSSTDNWIYDTGEGFLTRFLEAQSSSSFYSDLGPVGGPGLFNDMPYLAPTMGPATIPTDEKDLGSEQVFVLECWARFRRTIVNREPFAEIPVYALRGIPMNPAHDEPDHLPSQAHQANATTYGPHYLMRDHLATTSPGPRNPLRFCRFECRVDTSTPISSDWVPYVPGRQMRGRYVQARMILEDETGWYQVKSGDVEIRARFPMREYHEEVAVGSSTAWPGVSVTLPVHPITGGPLFPNAMFCQATVQAGSGAAYFASVTGQAAGATSVNVMVWDAGTGAAPGTASTVDLSVFGY